MSADDFAALEHATPIVQVADGVATTTSMRIANGTQVQHKNLRELIEDNLSDFEEFGRVRFETAKPPEGTNGGRPVKYAILNEEHATLLLTYMRNSDIVRDFKETVGPRVLGTATRRQWDASRRCQLDYPPGVDRSLRTGCSANCATAACSFPRAACATRPISSTCITSKSSPTSTNARMVKSVAATPHTSSHPESTSSASGWAYCPLTHFRSVVHR